MRAFWALVFTLVLSNPAFAQSAATGLGTVSCADFKRHYRDSEKTADLAYGSWAQGFMAGLNFAKRENQNFRDTSALSASEFIIQFRAYCDINPNAYFLEAVMDRFYKLPEAP